jgi:putative transcriptional regulator
MKKKPSHLSEAILEMAGDQHRVGIMSDTDYRQITIRHLGPKAPATARAISARYLNLTPGYVSQLERGVKQPKGPALALLNVIRRKGLEVVL